MQFIFPNGSEKFQGVGITSVVEMILGQILLSMEVYRRGI
jgi:hypothetical protein